MTEKQDDNSKSVGITTSWTPGKVVISFDREIQVLVLDPAGAIRLGAYLIEYANAASRRDS
jgi:hypothetical protein